MPEDTDSLIEGYLWMNRNAISYWILKILQRNGNIILSMFVFAVLTFTHSIHMKGKYMNE